MVEKNLSHNKVRDDLVEFLGAEEAGHFADWFVERSTCREPELAAKMRVERSCARQVV